MSAIATAVGEELRAFAQSTKPKHRICYHMRRYGFVGASVGSRVPQY